VRQTGSGVKIIACPIVRESDGLAMSSRNVLLEPAIRKNASGIFATLTEASAMLSRCDIPEIRHYVARRINSLPGFALEYFEIADETELIPARTASDIIEGRKYYCCIAVKAGSVRLIDNMEMRLD
jgi:pantoate--beta-alanine ligase